MRVFSRETRNEITEVTAATQAAMSQRADCQEVMANLHEAKKGRRRCRTSFQLSTVPSSNAFDCVQSSKFQQSEELRTDQESPGRTWRLVCQPWFILGELVVFGRLEVVARATLAPVVNSLHVPTFLKV